LARLTGHRLACNGGLVVNQAIAFSADGKLLATGGMDGTVLIWDLSTLVKNQRERNVALTADELEKWWTALGTAQPAPLLDVVDHLVEARTATLAFLSKRLQPVSDANLERCLADLDSPQFAKRDQAMRELAQMEFAAAKALKQVLAGKPTL